MTSYVSAELRGIVEARANRLCEYCLIHESDTYFGCQVDHVIAEKHGGETEASNLAFAGTLCNRAKGSDIGSISQHGEFTRFFNPRVDKWNDHFELNKIIIDPKTSIGEVTAKILQFNDADRVLERSAQQVSGRFPCPEAIRLLAKKD